MSVTVLLVFSPQKVKEANMSLRHGLGTVSIAAHPSLLDAFSDDTGKIV